MKPLALDQAKAVWKILVEHAAATDTEQERFMFLDTQTRGCTEYRFQGALGFGGKFWNSNNRWHVSCYKENETPQTLAIIARTNEELATLREK